MSMSTTTYPVHVDADLDPRLSRWLWVVKWVLVIPHYLVLVFLWAAFLLLSVVAFFGILFTGRYPRAIFDFNVGVLRWSWRVTYYAYGALGTDRYPPFTLHGVADYPAHLEVDYPEHLSRGLVLVKWWLLAIPHYIVVGLLVGGAGYAVSADNDNSALWGTGLIGILVLVAGIMLLFTGRYPQQLFDLVLGLNRWVLRVAGYVSLMTDTYPPFSLDQGGHEGQSGTTLVASPPPGELDATPPASPTPPPVHSGWSAGRVTSLVIGAFLVLSSVAIAIPAGILLGVDRGARDDAGFLMSDPQVITTPTYAAVSTNLGLHVDGPSDGMPSVVLGDTQLTATQRGDGDVFIGIARTADVRTYLDGVANGRLTRISNGEPVLENQAGGPPAMPPGEADIWSVQSAGPGTQSITWEPTNGNWTVVIMNADGSQDVSIVATVGAEVPALGWLTAVLFSFAVVFLIIGIVLIAVPLRKVSQREVQ